MLIACSAVVAVDPAAHGHDRWQDFVGGCCHVYLDVGSNVGVQVRKLFEPELYVGAPVLEVFDRVFGGRDERRRNTCALGLEGNERHRRRLDAIQSAYTQQGWRTKFLVPYAAAAREGLWLGLRLLEPLDTASLEDRFQRPSGWVVDRLQRQFALGNVQQCAPGRVVVAPGRWLWHDVIAKDLLGPP